MQATFYQHKKNRNDINTIQLVTGAATEKANCVMMLAHRTGNYCSWPGLVEGGQL